MRLRTFVRYTVGLGTIAVSVAAGVAIARRGREQAGELEADETKASAAPIAEAGAETPVEAGPPEIVEQPAPAAPTADSKRPAPTGAPS